MIKLPEKLIKETKAIIRLYLFLRHECGLRYADKLSARELRGLLKVVQRKELTIYNMWYILLTKDLEIVVSSEREPPR